LLIKEKTMRRKTPISPITPITPIGIISAAATILVVGCTIVDADPPPEADAGDGDADVSTVDDGCHGVSTLGECVNATTIRTCMLVDGNTSDDHTRVVEKTCPPDRTCQQGPNGAECAVVGTCQNGDVKCGANLKSVLTCEGSGDDSHWVTTPCDTDEQCHPGSPDSPAKCILMPSQGGGTSHEYTLSGRVQYEYRPVRADGKGWGAIDVQEIRDLYVTIYDDNDFIGAALTGYDSVSGQFLADPGAFVAILTREMRGPTQVWGWPLVFNYDTGQPLMAVAKLTNKDPFKAAEDATDYWAFGKTIDHTKADMGTWTIPESQGSAALHIFSWIDYGLLRSTVMPKDQMSLAVFWDPDVGTPSCGACFCGPGCGGAQIRYGETAKETDYYDSWIVLGGPKKDGETQWSRAVISHEYGHYVMQNYSKSPGEGGVHYVNAASKPGLAYSEAWATAFGQTNIWSPLYVDEQSGTFFWVDISKYTYSGGALAMPNPNGPIDQNVNENIGAGMIWKLFVDPATDPHGRNLGDEKVFGALTYPPLVNGSFNRGYKTVDLIDFFDAAICSGNASIADIDAVTKTTGFPYDASKRPCK